MTRRVSNRTRRSTQRAGFTLIELMVALVVGGIFVGGVYAVAKASTRHFYQQYSVAHMQASLRYGVNQLKKDISKAGLFASPNAGLLQVQTECGPPPGNIHQPGGSGAIAGISDFTDNCVAGNAKCPQNNLRQSPDNLVQVDSLVLLGNYVTASEYPIARALLVARNAVAIERQWHAFQRDFTTWFHSSGLAASGGTMGELSPGLLNQAFMPGRMVGLRTMTGGMHYSTISSVDTSGGNEAPVRIVLDNPIGQSCNVSGGWISPLSFIRYVVEDVPDNTASAERFDGLQGRALQLIRREVRPDDKVKPLQPDCSAPCTPDRVVLDYVVDFNVDFLFATATTPSVQDIVPITTTVRQVDPSTVTNTPELVRSVFINVAVRSPDLDPNLAHLPNGGKDSARMWDPLLTYRETLPGTSLGFTARVRAMSAEIFVPNIAYAGH